MRVTLLCLYVTLIVGLVGCAQISPPADALTLSLASWTQLKEENGNHYTYERSFLSYFGFGYITSFEVENDVVVSRSYEAVDENNNVTEAWTEQGAEVGTHETGDPPRTVEALYEEGRNNVLSKSRAENDVYLWFNNDVLFQCFYIPKNCADDCAVGPSIENLRFVGKGDE